MNEDLVERCAVALWCEFAQHEDAQWRWENRVNKLVKDRFRREARAVLNEANRWTEWHDRHI